MATLPVANPTLLELANRQEPDGSVAAIIEILNETNEILDDMSWKEGNLATGHRTTIRTGLPTPTWRRLNGGVMPDRSTTAQITASCGMLEAYSEIDVKEADLNGNTVEFRLSEDKPHLESIGQELASTLFYGNEATSPEEFTGLAQHFNDLSAESGENIIDAGGTGSDNASIWLVGWGDSSCHGIVPKGITAGMQHHDKGQQTVARFDAAGTYVGKMEAYVSHYEMNAGLIVKDWRRVVRIANIDKSLLTGDISSGADLFDLMVQALELAEGLEGTRPAFYVPKTVRSMLRRQLISKVSNSTLSMDEVGGKKILNFDGIPVRRVAALAADEARVV